MPTTRADRLATLSVAEEAEIRKLSPRLPLDEVQSVLEAIALRHGVGWSSWPAWKDSGDWLRLLSWAARLFDSQAYEALVAFVFQRAWPKEKERANIELLFESFADSIHMLGSLGAGPDQDEARLAAARAKRALAAMFIAMGSDGFRMAYAAMSQILLGPSAVWLSHAWGEAESHFERGEIEGFLTKPAVPGASKWP